MLTHVLQLYHSPTQYENIMFASMDKGRSFERRRDSALLTSKMNDPLGWCSVDTIYLSQPRHSRTTLDAEVKIIDFGLSKKYASDTFLHDTVGTVYVFILKTDLSFFVLFVLTFGTSNLPQVHNGPGAAEGRLHKPSRLLESWCDSLHAPLIINAVLWEGSVSVGGCN
jgi:hypothetical protein